MGHLFYILVLFAVIFNVSKIASWSKYWKSIIWSKVFKDEKDRLPQKSDFKSKDEWQNVITFGVITMYESFVILFGLITESWYVYLLMIIANILFGLILKGLKDSFSYYIGFVLTSIRTIILLFLFINHFHLHLDIWQTVVTLIK